MKQLAYVKLMGDEKLSFDDLPNDAKSGIKEIKKCLHAMEMTEKRGQNPTQDAIEKIQRLDKTIVRDIADWLEDKEDEQNSDPGKNGNELEKEQGLSPEDQAKLNEGLALESEMDALIKSGKTTLTTDEIKSMAPKCYKVIFSTYEQGQPNGIETTRYTFIEDQATPQTFNLKSK